MISYQVYQFSGEKTDGTNLNYFEGTCLSTDTKPTQNVANGSKLLEMDTATMYMYDAAGSQWLPWE